MQLDNMTVRFFGYGDTDDFACENCGNTDNDGSDVCPDCGGDMIDGEPDVSEIDETEFLERVAAGERIEYERHTVRENGVSQICLTVGLPQA